MEKDETRSRVSFGIVQKTNTVDVIFLVQWMELRRM